MTQEVSQSDILVAIEKVSGEVSGLRAIMELKMVECEETADDHEERLRSTERSIQRGKGAIGILMSGIAFLGVIGGWFASFIERS
jgi:hypothetical protein